MSQVLRKRLKLVKRSSLHITPQKAHALQLYAWHHSLGTASLPNLVLYLYFSNNACTISLRIQENLSKKR